MFLLLAFLQLSAVQPQLPPPHRWMFLFDDKEKRWSIDTNAPDMGGGVRQIWMKTQLHNAPAGTYAISKSMMNCKNAQWRDLEQTFYEHDLRTEAEKPLRGWDDVPEKGFIRTVFEGLCTPR
jgi:hypothetical protein